MRIVPVLDLLNGKVVRGVAGNRAAYAPIQSQLCTGASPASVAGAFASLHFKECYVADLDAIAGSAPDVDNYRAIVAAGLDRLWVDAGIREAFQALALDQWGSGQQRLHRIIIGSESLDSPHHLTELVNHLGPERLVFSLDLQAGRPLLFADEWRSAPAIQIVKNVLRLGVRRLIVLDLASVGVSAGISTEGLCREIRQADADVELIAGGGVRGIDDLRRLEDCGCDAALVASAIHDGKISADQLREGYL